MAITSKVENLVRLPRPRITREEHKARMSRAEELLFSSGWSPSVASRMLAAECKCSERQAFRYVRAVRAIYAKASQHAPGSTTEELLTILRARSVQCTEGDEPDWKASIKALELEARIRGLLDRKSTVTVQGTVGLQPLPALEGASEEELALLAQLHAARERRLAGVGEVVATAGELAPAGERREG